MIDKNAILKIFIDKNMTQRDLAKKMKKSPTTINKWLNNGAFPSTEEVNLMCDILGIDESAEKADIFLGKSS